jgi:hypothetical protein
LAGAKGNGKHKSANHRDRLHLVTYYALSAWSLAGKPLAALKSGNS